MTQEEYAKQQAGIERAYAKGIFSKLSKNHELIDLKLRQLKDSGKESDEELIEMMNRLEE